MLELYLLFLRVVGLILLPGALAVVGVCKVGDKIIHNDKVCEVVELLVIILIVTPALLFWIFYISNYHPELISIPRRFK